MKKWVFNFIVILICSFSTRILAADSGSCAPVDENGNTIGSCSWTFDGQTLTISGQGPMKDYELYEDEVVSWRSTAPWADYGLDLKNVVIQNGINSVGNYSFYTTAVEHIDLPNTITSIGRAAFQGARQIKELSIPNSVESIGWGTFNNMASLTSIVIPDAITVLPEHSLSESESLTTIVLGNNVNQIASDAFNNGYLSTVYCQETDGHGKSCADLLGNTAVASKLQTFAKDGDYYVLTDTNGNSTGEYFGSTSDMVKGSDYSCGATTSICATVLSEVGGANCDTIKSCRNLAEMADESVYCNSMSGCKELTDLVASETYCDSLESCKALSDMANENQYCSTVAECKALSDMVGGEICDSLDSCKALSDMANENQYCSTVAECKALNDMVGGENCDSLESCKALSDMAASGEYCTTIAECKRFMDLMNSGYCEGFAACKEMFNASVINYDGKRYGSLEDLYNGNALPSITRQEQGDGSFAVYKDGVFAGYKGKRIYTMEEANRVTKPTGNVFKIKYR